MRKRLAQIFTWSSSRGGRGEEVEGGLSESSSRVNGRAAVVEGGVRTGLGTKTTLPGGRSDERRERLKSFIQVSRDLIDKGGGLGKGRLEEARRRMPAGVRPHKQRGEGETGQAVTQRRRPQHECLMRRNNAPNAALLLQQLALPVKSLLSKKRKEVMSWQRLSHLRLSRKPSVRRRRNFEESQRGNRGGEGRGGEGDHAFRGRPSTLTLH